MKLGDYLNAINTNKQPLMDQTDDDTVERDYPPYIINRLLSYHPDSIMCANEMNMYPELDKKMQFDYLRHQLRPAKRYSKFQKPEMDPNIAYVKEYYNYSTRKAKIALTILPPEHLEYIKERLEKGGIKK